MNRAAWLASVGVMPVRATRVWNSLRLSVGEMMGLPIPSTSNRSRSYPELFLTRTIPL